MTINRGKVFWHGLVPNPARLGKIKRRGSLRHEVLWDDREEVQLVPVDFLQLASRYPNCCTYCKSRVADGTFPATAGDPVPPGATS